MGNNGVVLASETSDTLGIGNHERGDNVKVVCTPSDASGPALLQDSVTIENAAPSAPVVEIEPANATTHDELVATLTTTSVDADGDTIVYTYEWRKDGASYVPAGAADQISSGIIFRNEERSVTVTASDGVSTGLAGTDSVDVVNAPPSLSSCDITPAVPTVDDDLTVTGAGASTPKMTR